MPDFDRIIKVRCGGEVHRIGVETYEGPRDARFTMLDHPDLETILAFKAFGAAPPPCFRVVELLQEVVNTYRTGKDAWTGVQWYESFGDTPIQLEDVTSVKARVLAEDWTSAADYIKYIEEQAQGAKEEAGMAVDEAIRGYFEDALERATSAADEEWDASAGNSKVWKPMKDALKALQAFDVVEDWDEDDDA
jgi:hypothetical protein